MEIRVNNGTLHQWDTGRTVQITVDEGDKLEQVAFSCPRAAGPVIVNPDDKGVADIPDGLLRHAGMLTVNAMLTTSDRKRMTRSKDFSVEVAVLPEDYNSGSGASSGGSASKYRQPEWGVEDGAEVLAESVIALEDGQAMISAFTKIPTIGNVYTVNWNGTAYTCTAFEVNNGVSMIALGNGAAFGREDTGEPFAILAVPEDTIEAAGSAGMIMALDGTESVTLSITGETVHVIPKKFLENTSEPFFVTFIPEQSMANKTYEQIKEAIDAMRIVTLVCNILTENTAAKKVWCPLMAITGNDEIVFQNPLQNTKIIFAPDGTVRGES